MDETATIQIDSLCPKGHGLSTLQRPFPLPPLKIETAHTVPGDTVLVELKKKMRGLKKGRLLEVLKASSDRVIPKCIHANICGGCSLQQMDYASQLKEKERRIQLLFPNEKICSIIAADDIFQYRNKMEFTFSENKKGEKFLGLMIAQGAPYVFNLQECHLASPWFSRILCTVRKWWETSSLTAYHPIKNVGTLRYLTLREARRTGQKMFVLNVSGDPEWAIPRFELDRLQEMISYEPMSIFLRIHQTQKGSPTRFFEMHLKGSDHITEILHLKEASLSFKISPSSFFQPNTLQAEKLYNTAIQTLRDEKIDTLYDLYCGTGTLSMAASFIARQVIGIELSPEAIIDAEENKKQNNLSNIRFFQGDVGKVLSQLEITDEINPPDAVIVDPPRAGLDPAAIEHLKKLKPRLILYISCNPTTQAKNLSELLPCGYEIILVQPVDQFPHTYHIENIVLLKLKLPSGHDG